MSRKPRTGAVKHIFIVVMLTALCIGALTFFLSRDKSGESARSGRAAIVGVATQSALLKDLVETKIFTGTLEAEHKYDAAAKVGGRIIEIGVSLGDCIARGALIARLDSEEFKQKRGSGASGT